MKIWPLMAMSLLLTQCDRHTASSGTSDISVPSANADQPSTLAWITGDQFYKGNCTPAVAITRANCQLALVHSDSAQVKTDTLADMVRLAAKSTTLIEVEKKRVRDADPLIQSYTAELQSLMQLRTRDIDDITNLQSVYDAYVTRIAELTTLLTTLNAQLADLDAQIQQNPTEELMKMREQVASDIAAAADESSQLQNVKVELAVQITDLRGRVSDLDFQIEDAQQKLDARINSGIFTSPKLTQLMALKSGLEAAQKELDALFVLLGKETVIFNNMNLTSTQRNTLSRLVFKDVPRSGLFRRNNSNFDCNHKIDNKWNVDHYDLQVEWLECATEANASTKTFVCDANLVCKGMSADGTERKITVTNNSLYEYANGDTTDQRSIEDAFLL